MSYSAFTLPKLKTEFGINVDDTRYLFRDVPERQPTETLRTELDFNLPLALLVGTEKARSELIIAPILVDLVRQRQRSISLFSGSSFDVDQVRGLNGVCDYLISRSPSQLAIEAPVIAIVEAKKEDIIGAVPQCLAEMIAARIFNEAAGRSKERVYGSVTSGSDWRFLRLDGNTLQVDRDEYSVQQLPKILGILLSFVAEPEG